MTTTTTADGVPELVSLVVDLAIAMGVGRIDAYDACWEVDDLGDGWRMSANGHREPRENTRGCIVPAGSVLFDSAEHLGYVRVSGHGFDESPIDASMRVAEALRARIKELSQ